MTESSISKFDNIIDDSELTNGDGVYYIKCNWQYNSFTIYLTDLTNVWSSNITSKYIDSVLKPQGMALEEFMSLLKRSLIQQDKSKKQFDYKINKSKKSSSDIEFCIIIILSEFDSINIKSNIPLIRVNNNHQSFQNYFNWLFDKYKSLTDQNQQLVQLNQSLQSQFNQSIDQNKLFIKEKEKLESDLYEKFIIVLNEKKKKIREYKQKVESLMVENNNYKKQQSNTTCKCNKKSSQHQQQQQEHQPNTPIKNTPKKKIKFSNNSYGSIYDDIMGEGNDYDSFKNTIYDDVDNNSSSSSMSYKPTFNNLTPSLDLLSNDDTYNIPTSVRRRFKPSTLTNNNNETSTTTTITSFNNNSSSNNLIKTPTKNKTSISPNKNSPFKQQQQQQQQQQFTLNYHSSPIKRPKSNNNNYITQPITPIKAKSKSRIFVFDEEDEDGTTANGNNNKSNYNISKNKKRMNSKDGLNKSFNNDNDEDLEPGASALLNEL